ncbi:16S rRNA (cytidine1402-2'-O)-methyltransferase [Desulfohalotomaculum tongense]|uniref:16S rRNA (cytidine(1402)-2'-O)-methyltransferase n=1 Tax=Desulforadius tongensis TaxID=1216062 RepID=UPI00195B7521|nr:16S rRNA (cytidine1402-2'-O)-methyltransferase [Desulforadius tongensis]
MSAVKDGTLYLCATPIGNLEDITIRVLRVLKECDLIAAEDTRHTRKLLAHYDIHTPLTSYHAHNEQKKGEKLLEKLKQGQSVALVTDAGMPGISDPGLEIVQMALEQGVAVVPVPGATAGITALVISGLPCARFAFEGFLPANKKGRRRRLEKLAGEERTMVFYESPHRLIDTLEDMYKIMGDRPVAVAREITKKHEEVYRGNISGAIEYFKENTVKGEFTLVVSGSAAEEKENQWEDLPVADHVMQLMAAGMDKKQAIKKVARLRGLPKREVYSAVNMGNN